MLVLALGIGATTAIFTLVHAVLLKSLPVRDPGELYRLGREARCCYWGGYTQSQEFSLVSYQLFAQLRDRTPGFAELAAFSAGQGPFGVRRAGQGRASRNLSGRVRLRQLLRDVRCTRLRRAHAGANRRSGRSAARGDDELSPLDAAVRRRPVDRWRRLQSERQAVHHRGDHAAGFLRRYAAQRTAGLLSATQHRAARQQRPGAHAPRDSLVGVDWPDPAGGIAGVRRSPHAPGAHAVAAIPLGAI